MSSPRRLAWFVFTPAMLAASWACSLANTAAAQDDAETFQRVARPFLQRHCHACHGPQKQESQLRYDRLDGFQAADRNLWTMVHNKVFSGEMPPADRPQPSAVEKKQILSWIERQQRALGSGGLRRLNRRELSAALQDLTGLSVDFAAALPGDGKIAGFDTGADGLQDAADSVAQVMRVMRRAVDGIRFLEPATSKVFTADLRTISDLRRGFESWTAEGAIAKPKGIPRPGIGLLIEPGWVGERNSMELTVPVPAGGRGVLRLKMSVAAIKSREDLPNPHLWVEVGGQDVDYRELTATPESPQDLVYEIQIDDLAIVPSGVRISLANKIEIPYAVLGYDNEDRSKPEENLPGGTGLFRPLYDRKATPPEQQPAPFVLLRQIEIETDYVAPWPPAAWQFDVSAGTDHPQNARRLLKLWIERAWRRPAREQQQQRFLVLYEDLRRQGMSFDDALRAAFQAVLMSGPFRYLASPGDPDPIISQYAIASRLSFMLVGAPPDDPLLHLAAAGKLRDSAVIGAQVDRLLDDPRSEAFVRPFVSQWLEMGQPITVAMDYIQKQDFRFGRYLKSSMHEETIAYVQQLLAENRPAKELIVSDWTMMNDSLAIHYGYGEIPGGALRKVQLRSDDPRGGGILGHAGIQSMLCWMGENWVIYRGAWTLRHILNTPPPPPPLEVPELIPSDAANQGKTFKELLAQHQQDTRCAVCHKDIDPLGFAFQNFDLSGRWRDVEYEKYETSQLDGKIAWRGVGKSRPVDASGHLPRGEPFDNFSQCKQLIVQNYLPDLVGGMLNNLAIYATGRTPDVDDLAEIRQIIQQTAPHDFPLRDLVKAIVCSRAFLER